MSTTKPNAFVIPRHSKVAAAVKPRQRYKRGPDIVINAEASRRDAEKRFGMRWSRI